MYFTGPIYPAFGYPSSDEEGSFGLCKYHFGHFVQSCLEQSADLVPRELIEQQPDDYIERPVALQRPMSGPSEGEHSMPKKTLNKV